MRRIVPLVALLLVAAPVAIADHVSSSPSATARLAEEVSSSSWAVVVDWAVNCSGTGGDPNYYGSLNLVDTETNETIYMGGISSASGSTRQLVERRDKPRTMAPEIRASCGESGGTNHGSEFQTVRGAAVTVPARGSTTGTGDGGDGGGDTNPDRRPGGPADPLAPGGCANTMRAVSPAGELIQGTERGDLIYGLGGPDALFGNGGADCLVGRGGSDILAGGSGADRITGGSGKDDLSGGAGRDSLDGGGGADHLTGNGGVDRFDGGAGNDVIRARDRRRETIRCGSGRDRAIVDRSDRVRGCERVSRR